MSDTDEMEISPSERGQKEVTSGSGEEEGVFSSPPGNETPCNGLYSQTKNLHKELFDLITEVIGKPTLVITADLIESFRFYLLIPDEDFESKQNRLDFPLRHYIAIMESNNWTIKKNYLELLIVLAREEFCSVALPMTAINEMVETCEEEECDNLFDFVESHTHIWTQPTFVRSRSGKVSVLKTCNALLQRHSRSRTAILCGRILIFLANYFPFGDQSGLNLMSEFNTDDNFLNILNDEDDPYDSMEVELEVNPEETEILPELNKIRSVYKEQTNKKLEVDYNLYVKFWSIQEYFKSPLECYNKSSWKTFISYIQDVLNVFSSFKVEDTSNVTGRFSEDLTSRLPSPLFPRLGNEAFFFPKYLTHRRILESQMSDATHRRYFMIQLLIVLQYLTFSGKFKTKSQVLDEEQLEIVNTISDKVYTLLGETPPDGAEFAKAIQRNMEREVLWTNWKNAGCPASKKPPNTRILKNNKPRRGLGDIIQEAEEKGIMLMGNPELTRLWNICPDNLEACRSNGRNFMPSIDTFFADAFKELEADSASQSKTSPNESNRILSNANFGWRALRVLSRQSPHFFQMLTGSPIHPLESYLAYLLKKHVADKEPAVPIQTQRTNESTKSKPQTSDETTDENKGTGTTETADSEAQVEVEENMEEDEMFNPKDEEGGEEGELRENVRNLTDEEQSALGTKLESHWPILAAKLGFTKDEIDFFLTEHNEKAGAYMLRMWTEQEGDDATVADLLYILEGLKLKDCAQGILI